MIAVVQPHRYSRLAGLMAEFQAAFNDADIVYVAPVYPAGEAAIAGVDADALVSGLRDRGHHAAFATTGPDDLARELSGVLQPGDTVVCLGAGDITKWAAGLAGAIGAQKARAA